MCCTVVTCAYVTRSWCEIAVLDAGPGRPEGQADSLFTPYFTTRFSGMGQRLPLCRAIVERHDRQNCSGAASR
ncbi:ATP-binding protein [Aquisalimonas sp.]|uniref:ATP-binding protein n=1 Tax=Aquisalimonas sp. TaxID=1872621 RepID=UPI003455E309